jgi:hypothetical protein
MNPAKVVSLNVRASQTAHLCFEAGGILGESNVELGAEVKAFDFNAFHATLGGMPSVPGHPARLIYNFLEIQAAAAVKPATLMALRAEASKAALSKAINARANAYYAKYANAPAIISRMHEYYSPSVSGSKPNRLDILSQFSQDQMEQIRDAYLAKGRTGVVTETKSTVESITTGASDEKSVDFLAPPQTFSTPSVGTTLTTTHDRQAHMQMGASTSDQNETIVNEDYVYRVPYLENFAQYERAQISLIDEQFAQFMYGQNLPYLAAVFSNELSSIDSDVFRLQIAYLNTILLSPIAGTVTGIYRYPGEMVKAGEPVMRVENNADILLLATLIYRGPIAIGSKVAVETQLFGLPGPKTPIGGRVVAVRGQIEDDQWEVIVKCNNLDGSGKPIFPLGYHFAYDDTTVSIK